jgi:hypothetical protein
MANIAMLWFGNPMTGIQRLSIRSFLKHGHSVTIFTYGTIEAPDGVVFRDAGEFVAQESLFLSHDSYAAFSDIFRYHLLAKEEFIWADADTICLKPDWNFGDYVFSYQEPSKVTNNVLGYPATSSLAKLLKQEAVYEESKAYDNLGPVLLTRVISDLNLGSYVLPQETFNPLHWTEYSAPYDAGMTEEVLGKCKNSHALSLSNYLLKFYNFDRDNFPAGSAIAYWDELFK